MVIVMGVILAAGAGNAAAQQWTWPDRAENLTELPADFPPERLAAVMRGFSQALGVRCWYCHVGQEGQPLATFDFVSDENPNKDRARAMYRMLGMVNEQLDAIAFSGDQRVNMWCHTCHNGKPRPQTLAEALDERYREGGGDAAWTGFLDLRGRYFGAAAYDFTATSVNAIGASYAAQGDTATANRFFEDNVERYPDDWLALASMGDVWLERADTAQAIDLYRRSLEIQPGNPIVRARLAELGGG
jgi:tetratricopeptide (TPR) repeat protein